MASIKERVRQDGQMSFLITVSLGRDSDGKKIFKTTTFKPTSTAPTKARKEAEAFASQYEKQILTGDVLSAENITFEQFARQIWAKNWLTTKTPVTQEAYLKILEHHVFPHIGFLKLTMIRAPHIDKILADEKAAGFAAKSVRKTLTAINSVFRYAVKKQYVRENPCSRCDDLPPVEMRTGDDLPVFTLEQARRFLAFLGSEFTSTHKAHSRTLKSTGEAYTVPEYQEAHSVPLQWQIYFKMAVYGGFRRGELIALTWNDLDFQAHTVSINKAAAVANNEQFIKSPKTAAGIRTVVLPAEVFRLLSNLYKEQLATCLKLGTAWKGHRNQTVKGKAVDAFDDNTIFTQWDGLPVNASTPSHKFGELIDHYNATVDSEEMKLPKIRLHDLRHVSATLLIAEGTDIAAVSHRLGHAKISTTLDIYTHALPKSDQEAADKMEMLFS